MVIGLAKRMAEVMLGDFQGEVLGPYIQIWYILRYWKVRLQHVNF